MSIHFTRAEFIRSHVAQERSIDNSLPERLVPKLEFTMAGAERIRAYLGHALLISSGYRCADLNAAVGGLESSQHLEAEAFDFTCPDFGDPQHVVSALLPAIKVLGIDRLVLEGRWVHVSFTPQPRYQCSRSFPDGSFEPIVTVIADLTA